MTKSFQNFLFALNDDQIILSGSFKPITYFIFRFFIIIFQLNKFYFYLICLLFGQQLFRILCHPLYRKLDQSKQIAKLLIIGIIVYNIMLYIIFYLFIIPVELKTKENINDFIQVSLGFLEKNNHDPMIIMITIYIIILTKHYFNHMIDWIKTSKFRFFNLFFFVLY